MSRIIRYLIKFSETGMSHRLIIIFSIVILAGCTACSGTEKISDSTAKPGKTVEQERLEEIYWSRVNSAKMQFTQAEVDFMTGMIAHHAQALIMSDLAPKNDAGSNVRVLASRIINAQKDEIETMQRWLREREQPVPDVQIDGLILTVTLNGGSEASGNHDSSHGHMQQAHSGHAGMDHSGMPGMLTQQQLNELAERKGEAFDRTFLTYMIEHHKGAVTMVKELFSADGAASDAQTFRLASDIQVDQITEIERMKRMLQDMKDL